MDRRADVFVCLAQYLSLEHPLAGLYQQPARFADVLLQWQHQLRWQCCLSYGVRGRHGLVPCQLEAAVEVPEMM